MPGTTSPDRAAPGHPAPEQPAAAQPAAEHARPARPASDRADTSLYLPDVEAHRQPGVYGSLIADARRRGAEYSKIWDLFAFQQEVTVHLARFTQGALRRPASLSAGLRELIAAYTSRQNACGFCTEAHAAAAAVLLGDEALVTAVLDDLETSPLDERHKLLLRFVGRLTTAPAAIGRDDVTRLHDAGWDDEAIYYTVTTCALFNFYNRWIIGTGVPQMSDAAHRAQGAMLAERGYVRD